MEIRIERVYDAASASDGFRVLVDRLGPRAPRLRATRQRRVEWAWGWPRGLSKERAALDLGPRAPRLRATRQRRVEWAWGWAKEVAPSTELRKAFHHDDMSWDAFVAAYRAELAENPAVPRLRDEMEGHDVVTLLHSVHDATHNHAVLLRDALLNREVAAE